MRKVLITDGVHDILPASLKEMGYEVHYDQSIPRTRVLEIIQDYEGIIVNSRMFMDVDMMDRAVQLKFIGRLGSGLDIIDLPYAEKKGIAVINSPEGNCHSVAEHTMGMILTLLNNICRSNSEVRQKKWNREGNRGTEMRFKTIGIIGFGHIGEALARKLAGWEVQVLANDKYRTDLPQDMDYVKFTDFESVIQGSDIICLHVPLTNETKWLLEKSVLNQCKDGAILVNVSRGGVVKTADLIEALENEKLSGACLDVFENEKVSSWSNEEHRMYERLYERENVILSPHVAGWTHESKKMLAKVLVDKISQVF